MHLIPQNALYWYAMTVTSLTLLVLVTTFFLPHPIRAGARELAHRQATTMYGAVVWFSTIVGIGGIITYAKSMSVPLADITHHIYVLSAVSALALIALYRLYVQHEKILKYSELERSAAAIIETTILSARDRWKLPIVIRTFVGSERTEYVFSGVPRLRVIIDRLYNVPVRTYVETNDARDDFVVTDIKDHSRAIDLLEKYTLSFDHGHRCSL